MIRVDIDDMNSFRLMLNANGNEYIDAILDSRVALFVNNTREMFASCKLSCVSTDEKESFSVRIPRKLLLSFASAGYFTISCSESEVTIAFFEQDEFGVSLTCKVTFARQQIWTNDYKNKLELVDSTDESEPIDLSSCGDIAKIGNLLKEIVNINLGVISVSAGYAFKLYQQVDTDANFSLSANSLLSLLKISKEIFDYRNYVGVKKGCLLLLATKTRGQDNSDYALLAEEHASFKADIDVSYLMSFLSKVQLEQNVINFNLLEQGATIDTGVRKYFIPVMVKNLEKHPSLAECVVNMPKQILLILNKLVNDGVMYISNKKTFVQLDVGDYVIIFRR